MFFSGFRAHTSNVSLISKSPDDLLYVFALVLLIYKKIPYHKNCLSSFHP